MGECARVLVFIRVDDRDLRSVAASKCICEHDGVANITPVCLPYTYISPALVIDGRPVIKYTCGAEIFMCSTFIHHGHPFIRVCIQGL